MLKGQLPPSEISGISPKVLCQCSLFIYISNCAPERTRERLVDKNPTGVLPFSSINNMDKRGMKRCQKLIKSSCEIRNKVTQLVRRVNGRSASPSEAVIPETPLWMKEIHEFSRSKNTSDNSW